MHGLLCIDEQKSNIKCNFFFFCIKILNISSVNDYSIGSTVPNWILVTIVLMCPVLCDCCLTALRWFSSSDAVCFFVLGDLWLFWDEEKKKLFVRPSRSINGERGGEVMVAAKILATSEISTFLVFKQGAFYHSNGYSCTLFNTGTQKSVVDAWGPLLDHIFFLFPPPPDTHTHIVFSSLICSNGYDSPLPFAKTLNFSFKYICSFFPPPHQC